MSPSRYLNGVLTIIAVLLTLQLWTSWTGGPAAGNSGEFAGGMPDFASVAHAQEDAKGIPNAGAQRREIVELLKKLTIQTEALTGLFRSGQARVKVEGAPAESNR